MEEVRPWPRKSSSETLGSCEGCKITFELVLFHDCFHNVWSGNRWETLWARYSLHFTHQGVSEIQRCFKSSFACTKLHPLHEITGVNRGDVWSRKPSVWFNSSWIHARGATERALVWTDADFWVRPLYEILEWCLACTGSSFICALLQACTNFLIYTGPPFAHYNNNMYSRLLAPLNKLQMEYSKYDAQWHKRLLAMKPDLRTLKYKHHRICKAKLLVHLNGIFTLPAHYA